MGKKPRIQAKSDKEIISFYLRKDLTKQLDKIARSGRMTRSQLVEWMITTALPLAKDLAKKIEKAYLTISPPEITDGEPG